MSYQEKRRIASIISSVLVFGVYFAIVIQMHQEGRFAGANATSLLGKSILLLIVGAIITNIVVTILFNIVSAIAEGESNPSFVVDERDKLIELKGMRISEWVTGFGFALSMGLLALGQSALLVFNVIVCGFALGDVVGSVAMLRIHRRGF